MQFGLTDEQQMIVDTVRSFVEHEIYPHEDAVERSGEVPQEIVDEIKRKTIELGFYACNFPEEVGGAGLSHVDFALVERELGRGSMALNHFFGRPQNILMACASSIFSFDAHCRDVEVPWLTCPSIDVMSSAMPIMHPSLGCLRAASVTLRSQVHF